MFQDFHQLVLAVTRPAHLIPWKQRVSTILYFPLFPLKQRVSIILDFPLYHSVQVKYRARVLPEGKHEQNYECGCS